MNADTIFFFAWLAVWLPVFAVYCWRELNGGAR